jgi:hypothetical protein
MNKYLVSIRIKGQVIKTTIEADSAIHARLLGQWHYGVDSVVGTPAQIKEQAISAPQTSEQTRVKSLQDQAERAKDAVKAERARQKIKQGQNSLAKIAQK